MKKEKYTSRILRKGTKVYVQFDNPDNRWILKADVKVELEPFVLTPENDPCNKSGIGNG